MRLRARGFFLFSFAFFSLLAFTETSEIPLQIKHGKAVLQTPTSSSSESEKILKKTGGPRTLDAEHGLYKRSAEVYPQEEEKKRIFNDVESPEKRTRLGFTGMRGKKEYSADDYCGKILNPRLESVLNKRFFRSFNELLGGKRATLAFHGMRGKKSQDYENEIMDSEGYDSLPHQEFLISSGLIDDPEETMEIENDKSPEEESLDVEETAKRSPYAFQGMRGKKKNSYDLKRAMGFLGMRGKKKSVGLNLDYKRAPQTNFFRIKGKRDPLSYDLKDFSLLNQDNESGSPRNRLRRGITWLNNSKKAKNAFFGIRGKKSTQENQ